MKLEINSLINLTVQEHRSYVTAENSKGVDFFLVFLCVDGAYTTVAHESTCFTLDLLLNFVNDAKISKIHFLVSIFFLICLKFWLLFVPFWKPPKCWFSCLFKSASGLLSEQIGLCHLCR